MIMTVLNSSMTMVGNINLHLILTASVLLSFLKLLSLAFPPSYSTTPTSVLKAVPAERGSDLGHSVSPGCPKLSGLWLTTSSPKMHSLPLMLVTVTGFSCIPAEPALPTHVPHSLML